MNIKKRLFFQMAACCFFLASVMPTTKAFADSSPAHVRASSMTNQFPTSGHNIAIIEHIDTIDNIEYINHQMFGIKYSGTYFVVASGEIGVDIVAPPGHLDLWLVRNGTPVPNSRTRVSIRNSQQTSLVVVTQAIIDLNKNDTISVGYSSSSGSIGLVAIDPTSSNEPAIPSVALSMVLVK